MENIVSTVVLVVVIAAIIGLVWWASSHRGRAEPRHECPYCKKIIRVRVEPDGEEKKP